MQLYCTFFLVFSSAVIVCSGVAVHTHDIYPEATCQNLSADIECLTLSNVTNERDKYFTSNSMLVFHDGDHILQWEIVYISNISNFTLQGHSSSGSGLSYPTITCKFAFLVFSDVSIRIESVNFNFCGIHLSQATAVVQDTRFENGRAFDGGALAIYNSSLQIDGINSFIGNTAETYGGAIYTEWSNLTFSGSTAFTDNVAHHEGGAIFGNANNILLFNGDVTFESNTARDYGGAVSVGYSNDLSFDGNSILTNNMAQDSGGAIHAYHDNTLAFSGNSTFTGNSALYWGGSLITSYNNTFTFTGNTSFVGNTASVGGAALAEFGNSLSFNGNTSFISNSVDGSGGAVYVLDTNTLSFSGNSSFVNNSAVGRGNAMGTEFSNNTLSFHGTNTFVNNTGAFFGGTVDAWQYTTVSFSGDNTFLSNSALYGGAVSAEEGSALSFNGNSTFTSNAANNGGAVYAEAGSRVSFDGTSSFQNNTLYDGGGSGGGVSAVFDCHLSFTGMTIFKNNSAIISGGAIYTDSSTLSMHGDSTLEDNSAVQGGGFAHAFSSLVYLSGSVSMSSNSASFGGGSFIESSSINSTGNIVFAGNQALHGGGLYVQSSNITLQGDVIFQSNMVTSPDGAYGGGIFARSSILRCEGHLSCADNLADFGGALAFFGVYDGVLQIKDLERWIFEGNLANKRGGAIYVEDDPFTSCEYDQARRNVVGEACFYQLSDEPYNCFDHPGAVFFVFPRLVFQHNRAVESGDDIYGGHLETCVVCIDPQDNFDRYSYFGTGLQTLEFMTYFQPNLSSDPYKVCICQNNETNCDQREIDVTVYPGQVLARSMTAVGQTNGTVPSIIRAVSNGLISASDFKETQPAENDQECSKVQYPLLSTLSQTSLKLYSDEPCSTSGYPLTFQINFLPCPVGFTLSDQGTCICDERLRTYTQNCSIETLTISRREGDSFWVGVEGLEKLILHPHCPFDYCAEESVDIQLNITANYSGTDVQCANGRSSILCGACQPGRSLALGSSRCLSDCSNGYLALLLVFVFAGVVLVAFLILCRLTVAEGTLSGLIFYANVLAINQTVFFPSGERNLLTVFIAWLNLDLGIEACFFESLDTYYSTWLQFVFPVYIWVIVGTIIVLADRSVLVAKILGSANPVAVLATLFLLSYTKLLRAIMTAFSFTTLDHPDGDGKYVWLYDGNIEYLDRHDGRHIGLFLFSLLFLLFVFLPYTLLLLCGQWVQRKLWWLPSTWQLYTNSFLDVYYGPYKHRHRYWTGLLLLARFVMLFIGTAMNIRNPQDPLSNLLVILVVSLVACCWVVRGIYKKWYHDLLETSFHFNLIVLVGGTYQVRQSGGNQAALVYSSVGVVFVTFIGIVSSAVVKRVKEKVSQWRRAVQNHSSESHINEKELVPDIEPAQAVSYSILELVREDPDQKSGEIKLTPLSEETPEWNQ